MDFDVLGFGLFGDEDVRKNDGESEENDDDYQTLTQITYRFSHPGDTTILSFLGVTYIAFRVMMA